ncbi:MAG: HypC/HybG/HupF family hydrogenase formation chaperone [Magnetococcales bacterium]|nr:HypC/HybG/HupF family hydrogenase formation chaperone [Magnetococcales bacterium]MBF0151385.1 HypC/HybG/HupF family hydrogenase formation chaperone [Magnetococcales bacterium]MBF0174351.1 HypC/HybG/HupF family hydrogenase formation chaperone [Magnetococcales bacterium]MBF0348318.1 HypC/HybG/HupF family hydrogenase formation chaperone [Magnetococcales bacterium]MBF0631561.1 HypC/HybG/HupF family hydrogenase formation chaperone [Magnetococcales bacterium]
MCLAVPMKIIALHEDGTGTVALDGIRIKVGLMLVEHPRIGDHVLIHAGYAIEKLDTTEAMIRLDLFKALADTYREETGQEVTLIAPPRPGGDLP